MERNKTGERDELRKRILVDRNSLAADSIHAKSNSIRKFLWQSEEFAKAGNVFIYVNFRSEVETFGLINDCLEAGKRVAVPLTIPGQGLEAYAISDQKKDLRAGFCSILEPDPVKCSRFPDDEIDIVVLPGSVFDERGGRLGYGGGYYDRFLTSNAPAALRIGIAFELQVVRELPLLPHDRLLDILVTEKRIARFSR